MSEYFSGRVQSVRFNNPAQSYYVLEMALDGSRTATVRGHVHGLAVQPQTWFGFDAHWENHATYGPQLVIDKAPVLRGEWDIDTALRMLQGHGVGPHTCESLRTHFGDRLLEVLGDAAQLQESSIISEFTAQYIVSRWQTVRALFQSLKFLGDLDLPRGRVQQIYAHFGDDAEKVLSEDPWALVQIDGVSFEQADEVATRLGLSGAVPARLRGASLHTCKMRRGMGHLFLTSGEFVEGVRSYVPEATKEDIARTLKTLHDESLLVLDNRTRPQLTAIYEPWFNRLEIETAKLLSERNATARIKDEDVAAYLTKLATVGTATKAAVDAGESPASVAREAVREWSSHGNLTLSAAQLEGAVHALTEPVSIVTGLPGTGKTTMLKVAVKVLQDAGIPFLLVAPTGIAAKRLTSVTGAQASTIHRAFGARGGEGDDSREATYAGIVGESTGILDGDGSGEFWGYSAAQPHPAQVIIVDESSMVDQHLLFRVLTCTSKTCRIVFVGDAAQLPSVGPGNVLRDLIDSSFFPVVSLHEIFRQDEASAIVFAAHAINAGKMPDLESSSKDFTFLRVREESRVLDTVLEIVQKLYERRANFQVLSPRHGGTLGVTSMNLRIRELLNPKQPGTREMRLGSETVREGDRIMVSKNNYRFEIFNGDTGKIDRLDPGAQIVTIKIHGPPTVHVQLPFKDAPSHLRLAYAVTTHKSQGQEYDVIVMPWVSSFRHQLQRNLIYTAITRARKKVILVGHVEALERAVQNNRVDARNSLFPDRLRVLLAGDESAAVGE